MTYTVRHVVEIEERVDVANDKAAKRAFSLGKVALQLNNLQGVQYVGFITTVVTDSNGAVVSEKHWRS